LGIDGACILLWLSIEQLLKILIISKELEAGLIKCSVENLPGVIGNKAKKLGGRDGHNLKILLNNFKKYYSNFNIEEFEESLKKINEYFNRRYPTHSSTSISLLTLNNIDKLFFLLRDLIHKDVSMGTIDEIAMKKDNGLKQSIPIFHYAYIENRFFRARKHRKTRFSDFKNPPRIIIAGED